MATSTQKVEGVGVEVQGHLHCTRPCVQNNTTEGGKRGLSEGGLQVEGQSGMLYKISLSVQQQVCLKHKITHCMLAGNND